MYKCIIFITSTDTKVFDLIIKIELNVKIHKSCKKRPQKP